MTVPTLFGIGMSIHCFLSYKLTSPLWRKWLGIAMTVVGGGILYYSRLSKELDFAAGLLTLMTGWMLFSERDFHVKDEE